MPNTAPYRFVPLNERVVHSTVPEEERRHDRPTPGHLSGRIELVWETKGPLLIGDPIQTPQGDTERVLPFVLLPEGKAGRTAAARSRVIAEAAIPGASLRGMVRSVFEIATFSRLSLTNAHYRFGFRDFADPDYQQQLLDSCKVGAGWLERADDGSFVLRCCTWRPYPISALLQRPTGVPGRESWIGADLKAKYGKLGYLGTGGEAPYVWRDDLLWPEDGRDHPASLVCAGALPKGRGGQAGNKQVEYVFFAPAGDRDLVTVRTEIMDDFRRVHGAPDAKGGFAPTGNWQLLRPNLEAADGEVPAWPRAQRRIPVFYVGNPGAQLDPTNRLRLGLTRLFKLGHRFSIGELRGAEHARRWPLDMADAVFGFVDRAENELGRADARKGRVLFGFATLAPESRPVATVMTEVKAVLMTPRASFDPYYLVRASGTEAGKPVQGYRLSYSHATDAGQALVRLAGRKRYPVRGSILKAEVQAFQDAAAAAKPELVSHLHFLAAKGNGPLRFASTVRFHNLHPVELGALLWSLTLGDPGRYHMVGHAKPYGFGRLRLAPGGDGQPCLTLHVRAHGPGAKAEAWATYRAGFCTWMSGQLGKGRAFDNEPQIRDLLKLATPAEGDRLAAAGLLRYPGSGADPLAAHQAIKRDRRAAENAAGGNKARQDGLPGRLLTI